MSAMRKLHRSNQVTIERQDWADSVKYRNASISRLEPGLSLDFLTIDQRDYGLFSALLKLAI
jgi:hypothetical protein